MKSIIAILGFVLGITAATSVEARDREIVGHSVYSEVNSEVDHPPVTAAEARESMRQQFVELGVSPDEASARVLSLSDSEVIEAAQLANEPAGENDTITIGVGTAILIGLILLIL